MGAGPQVVAVSSYDEDPPQVKSLPRVGALLDPDVERILSLKPDLVITYGSQVDLQAQLTRAGIPMFDYRHGGLTAILETMRALGVRTGHPREADAAAREIEARLAAVRSAHIQLAETTDAARVRPRAGHAAEHLRQRRPRLPARHARGRGRHEHLRRHRSRIGAGHHRADSDAGARGDPRGAVGGYRDRRPRPRRKPPAGRRWRPCPRCGRSA